MATAKSGIRMPGAVIVRPAYEVAMFGGPDHVKITIGTMVRVHPCTDLFMRGARYAEVRRIRDCAGVIVFDVRPYVAGAPVKGKLHSLRSDNVIVDEKGLGA